MKRKYRQYNHDEYQGMSQTQSQSFSPMKTPNTIGGAWQENRGRRSASPERENFDNPFENDPVENWNHRQGWDDYFSQKSTGKRAHGGSLVGPDHTGRGPKGYRRADERIYEDVCETLSLSSEIDASEIEVTVKQGRVHLTGEVENRQTKRMVEFEIENISGVIDVQNDLAFSTKESTS